MQEEYVQVDLPIPRKHNPGEWRLSKQVTGPKGGKSWKRMTSGIPATGATYRTQLEVGAIYKTTVWGNRVASSQIFTILPSEEIEYLE